MTNPTIENTTLTQRDTKSCQPWLKSRVGKDSVALLLGPYDQSDPVALEVSVEERHHVEFKARSNRSKILEQGRATCSKEVHTIGKVVPELLQGNGRDTKPNHGRSGDHAYQSCHHGLYSLRPTKLWVWPGATVILQRWKWFIWDQAWVVPGVQPVPLFRFTPMITWRVLMINQWRRKIYELGSWVGSLDMRVQTKNKLMFYCTSTQGWPWKRATRGDFSHGQSLGGILGHTLCVERRDLRWE